MSESHPLAAPTFPWTIDPSLTPFDAVRSSCAQCMQQAQYVQLDHSAIQHYAQQLDRSLCILLLVFSILSTFLINPMKSISSVFVHYSSLVVDIV